MSRIIPIGKMYRNSPDIVLGDILVGLVYGFDSKEGRMRLTQPSILWDYSDLHRYLFNRFIANQYAFPDVLPFEDELGDYRDALKYHVLKCYHKVLFRYMDQDANLRNQYLFSSESRQLGQEFISSIVRDPRELQELSPRMFEILVAKAYESAGWNVELTKTTRDGGYDIKAIANGEFPHMAVIECKKYGANRKVGIGFVRQLLGVKMHEQCDSAILVTTSGFTGVAVEFAKNHILELKLVDYEDLVAFFRETAKGFGPNNGMNTDPKSVGF